MLLLVVAALAGGYFFWTKKHTRTSPDHRGQSGIRQPREDRRGRKADSRTAASRPAPPRGTVQGSLELMRRLVPERNEVPTLIDDISTKAKVRGITIGKIQPLLPEPARRSTSIGTGWRSTELRRSANTRDIASLPRIIVPQDVTLSAASPAAQKLLADRGALLLPSSPFDVRESVRAASPGRQERRVRAPSPCERVRSD